MATIKQLEEKLRESEERFKRSEDRGTMEHAVTRLLMESTDPMEVMPKIIQTVCETLGWHYGAYWSLDKQSELLRQADTWHVPSIDISEFVDSSRQEAITIQSTKSPKLGGIIRRAWLTKEPLDSRCNSGLNLPAGVVCGKS